MELLTPASCRAKGIEISAPCPWLGFPDHDTATEYVGWNEYPASRGWDLGTFLKNGDLTSVRDRAGQQPSIHSLFAFLQAYMYFGFLEAIMKRRVNIESFIRVDGDDQSRVMGNLIGRPDNPECPVLDTKTLGPIFDEWCSSTHAENIGPKERELWAKHVMCEMVLLVEAWNALNYRREVKEQVPVYFHRIIRYISVLNGTVKTTLRYIFDDFRGIYEIMPKQATAMHYDYGVPAWDDMCAELRAQGYCPFQIENVSGLEPSFYFEYLNARADDLLPYPRDHLPDVHKNCTEFECLTYNIDPDWSQPSRCSCGQDCPKLRPYLEDVLDALNEGKIPAICYYEGRLEVIPIKEGYKYIAFSHVWADGLGSVTEDGLFDCQVRRLNDLTNATFFQFEPERLNGGPMSLTVEEVPKFWIDSLCVPRAPEARSKAIRLMAETYAGADNVVVLDKVLSSNRDRAQVVMNLTSLELLMRIHLSGWRSRLWTLQEGMLAKDLMFEVSDQVLAPYPYQRRRRPQGQGVAAYMSSILEDMLNEALGLPEELDATVDMADAVNLVIRRRTTKPGDETLALAPLLGLDVSPLLRMKIENRMAGMLYMKRYLPPSLPFFEGPKYSESSFRWAPQTFMSKESRRHIASSPHPAIFGKKGLFACYVMILPDPDIHPGWVGRTGPGSREFFFHRSSQTVNDFNPAYYFKTSPGDQVEEFNAIILEAELADTGMTGIAVMVGGREDGDEIELHFEENGQHMCAANEHGQILKWKWCRFVTQVNIRTADGNRAPRDTNAEHLKCLRVDQKICLY